MTKRVSTENMFTTQISTLCKDQNIPTQFYEVLQKGSIRGMWAHSYSTLTQWEDHPFILQAVIHKDGHWRNLTCVTVSPDLETEVRTQYLPQTSRTLINSKLCEERKTNAFTCTPRLLEEPRIPTMHWGDGIPRPPQKGGAEFTGLFPNPQWGKQGSLKILCQEKAQGDRLGSTLPRTTSVHPPNEQSESDVEIRPIHSEMPCVYPSKYTHMLFGLGKDKANLYFTKGNLQSEAQATDAINTMHYN